MIAEDKAACLFYIRLARKCPIKSYMLMSVVCISWLNAILHRINISENIRLLTDLVKSGKASNWCLLRCFFPQGST